MPPDQLVCNRLGLQFVRHRKCLRIRRLYQGFGMEVLTTAEMERADRLTIAAGTPGFALMMSAGQAVAEAAMGLVEEGPIMVVAGRGNNGGDGVGAAVRRRGRGAASWWGAAGATMAATGLWRRPNWRRAAVMSRSSCCASATACRVTRRSL